MIQKLKMNPFFRKLIILGTHVLSAINQFIPKNNTKILFYDSTREFLDDNTEALYSYMKKKGFDRDYKMVCCVPNQKSESPYNHYTPISSLKGVITFLTAKYVFFSFGDFRIRPSKNQIVVNQWHGTGTKKGGKQLNDAGYKKERLDNFTYFIASSDKTAPIMAEQFGCELSKILVQGSARNDYLFSKKETLHLFGISREKYRKVIIWMPTFRNSKDNRFHDGRVSEKTQLPILYEENDIEKLDGYLKLKNVSIVIKAHPMSTLQKGKYSNVLILDNKDLFSKRVRLYEFIKDFDALITDYSSVFPDFLLLNRPIGFTMDDYDEYEKTRGFFFDNFKEYMPGHHIYTYEGMIRFIEDVINNEDTYEEARKKVLPVFWKYTDGHNCERLVESVGIKKR